MGKPGVPSAISPGPSSRLPSQVKEPVRASFCALKESWHERKWSQRTSFLHTLRLPLPRPTKSTETAEGISRGSVASLPKILGVERDLNPAH